MYSLTNIPHAKANAEIVARVDGAHVKLVCVDKGHRDDPMRSSGIGDLYIGDHMFERPDDLRAMVGQALVFAIEKGRAVGYAQAQGDIRDALGIERKW